MSLRYTLNELCSSDWIIRRSFLCVRNIFFALFGGFSCFARERGRRDVISIGEPKERAWISSALWERIQLSEKPHALCLMHRRNIVTRLLRSCCYEGKIPAQVAYTRAIYALLIDQAEWKLLKTFRFVNSAIICTNFALDWYNALYHLREYCIILFILVR